MLRFALPILCVAGWLPPAVVTAEDRPLNVLIIHTDEHHFKTLGCYGGTIVDTPNIDWIAEHGAIATSFYGTTPVCSPSRAAFMTGRYPQNTPVVTNNIPLADDMVTFAMVLKQADYSTGYAGKWHLAGAGKPQWAPPKSFGFDDNAFMFNRGHWKMLENRPQGPRVAARNRKGQPTYNVKGADEDNYTTDWLTVKTLDFIQQNREKPFCWMVSYPDPHGPNTVRAPYDKLYLDEPVAIPVSLKKSDAQTPRWAQRQVKVTPQLLRKIMPQYWGMVKCVDDNVGRILAALRRNDLLDKTLIVFTSDHGDLCGEHCRLEKGVPYEGSARIPFLLYCPGKVTAGTKVSQALSCVNFFPTLMSLLGRDIPKSVEGRDASPLFLGRKDVKWDDFTAIRSTPGRAWLCGVTDRYKLIYSQTDPPWLFDLQQDPDELTNIFDRPESRPIVAELTAKLIAYANTYHDPYGSDPKIAADMQAALKSSAP